MIQKLSCSVKTHKLGKHTLHSDYISIYHYLTSPIYFRILLEREGNHEGASDAILAHKGGLRPALRTFVLFREENAASSFLALHQE